MLSKRVGSRAVVVPLKSLLPDAILPIVNDGVGDEGQGERKGHPLAGCSGNAADVVQVLGAASETVVSWGRNNYFTRHLLSRPERRDVTTIFQEKINICLYM